MCFYHASVITLLWIQIIPNFTQLHSEYNDKL